MKTPTEQVMHRDTWKQLNRESYFKRSRVSLSTQLDWPLQILAEPNIRLIIWFIGRGGLENSSKTYLSCMKGDEITSIEQTWK